MKTIHYSCSGRVPVRYFPALLLLLLLAACGGSGSGDGSSGGGGSAGSTSAPYLISSPTVTYALNGGGPDYDVTVTIEADSPAGIFEASLWVIDDTGFISEPLDLVNTSGTTWEATTNIFLPFLPGNYNIDDITLFDADPLGTSYKMGWYVILDPLSTTHYYVDQRDIFSGGFTMIDFGVSNKAITSFTLP